VRNTSFVTADGERVLQHQVDVDAAPAAVWRAFTTSEGLRGFAAPVAAIDFRIGGHWEASYNPAGHLGDPGNILNEVVAYLPGRMLTIRIARTPPRVSSSGARTPALDGHRNSGPRQRTQPGRDIHVRLG
jgi:hypothetical protein